MIASGSAALPRLQVQRLAPLPLGSLGHGILPGGQDARRSPGSGAGPNRQAGIFNAGRTGGSDLPAVRQPPHSPQAPKPATGTNSQPWGSRR